MSHLFKSSFRFRLICSCMVSLLGFTGSHAVASTIQLSPNDLEDNNGIYALSFDDTDRLTVIVQQYFNSKVSNTVGSYNITDSYNAVNSFNTKISNSLNNIDSNNQTTIKNSNNTNSSIYDLTTLLTNDTDNDNDHNINSSNSDNNEDNNARLPNIVNNKNRPDSVPSNAAKNKRLSSDNPLMRDSFQRAPFVGSGAKKNQNKPTSTTIKNGPMPNGAPKPNNKDTTSKIVANNQMPPKPANAVNNNSNSINNNSDNSNNSNLGPLKPRNNNKGIIN